MIRTVFFAAACSALSPVAKAQDKTIPPPPQQAVLTLHARGSQIYNCQQVQNAYQWVFIAPVARLFDDAGNEVATHGDGPVWNYQDSSSIQGVVQQKVSSPDAASIPWLLLKAVNPARTGVLTRVDFIRRSDTQGGIAPTTGCDADHLDANARVPYTATYTFYSAKP
ncbi:DUF3455 domain-containing protein [Granulicella sp. S190]|uniref:DUF3455 domain-containing protein n=1 Tax=Granulicella sp. S190 TaxID=1747226 RepID=UPI0020B116CC|nr:DUF3455 domain-containing protein [Granulicella sp. S190]